MCDFLGNQHLSGDWAAADSVWCRSQDNFLQPRVSAIPAVTRMARCLDVYHQNSVGKKCNRRKRGGRGRTRRKLKDMTLNDCRKLPPLPTVLLSNLQSIHNKLDELESWVKLMPKGRETCLLAFTETWLGESDWDEELSLSGFGSPFRLDRSADIANKRHGGGVCFYIDKRYCNTIIVRESICTPDIELLTTSLRPYYLPWEFQQLFFTVYIHLRANTSAATQLIADATRRLDSISWDAPKFILGDFNHCKLDRTLKNIWTVCVLRHYTNWLNDWPVLWFCGQCL